MLLEPIPSDLPRAPFDLAGFAKRTVIEGIEAAADDPSEMKFRILLAYECGHLSLLETTRWIRRHNLQGA